PAPLNSPTEPDHDPRRPAESVSQLVISDLEYAASALPPSYRDADKGRATKGAALSLLGKVYLTRKEYDKAIEQLRPVLSLGYTLLPDYADVFEPANKNHAESVFDVQFQGDNQLGEHSGFIYTFAPRQSNGAVIDFPGQNGGGWNIPTLEIISSYEDGDKRKDVSLKEGYTNLEGQWVAIPFINKYNHPHSIRNVTNDNWPVLRYADVLLMLAEAINELEGPSSEAYEHLNAVRERAGLEPLNGLDQASLDRKSTRLNSSHVKISYAVFCLKKKT